MRYLILLLSIFVISQASAQDRHNVKTDPQTYGFRWDPSHPSPDLLLPSGPVPVEVGKTEYYQVRLNATPGWKLIRETVRPIPRFAAPNPSRGCFVVCAEDQNNDATDKVPVSAGQCFGEKLETSITFYLRMSVNRGQTCQFDSFTIAGEETK